MSGQPNTVQYIYYILLVTCTLHVSVLSRPSSGVLYNEILYRANLHVYVSRCHKQICKLALYTSSLYNTPEDGLLKTETSTVYISFRSPYLFYLAAVGVEVVYCHLITLRRTPQSVRLPWTRDRPLAETSTWQTQTLKRDKHPYPRWDSNSRSQQALGRRPTP
jgi:hypothetical protein